MSYRATSDSTTLSDAEMLDEARRILFDMHLEHEIDRMPEKEQRFLELMIKNLTRREDTREVRITVKQLWWIRDLKEKYLG